MFYYLLLVNAMASPQLENGYTSFANEIAEQLAKTQLNGYECRYLWVLWRHTYGWHKTEDRISNSQFVEKTGLKKQHLWRTESNLIKRKIVTKNGYKLSFNKNYSQWVESDKLPKKVTVTNLGTEVTNSGIKVTKNGAHKRNYQKKLSKEIATSVARDIVSKFSKEGAEVIKAFEEVDPKNKGYYNHKTQRACADFLVTEYGKDRVLWVIKYLPVYNRQPYAKRSYTPFQLKENWQAIKDHIESIKAKKVNSIAFT